MQTLRYLLPFSYFAQSRLQKPKDVIFHTYYEWLINIVLIVLLAQMPVLDSLLAFFAAYLCFISIYELGYLYNDVESVRFDPNPRRRIKDFNPTNTELTVWALTRLSIFGAITWYWEFYTDIKWWGFYGLLILFYSLHNTLRNKQLKPFTFMNLAVLRFFAPIFMFIPAEKMPTLGIAVILNYVLYRSLTYFDSKGLLNMPDRTKAAFKMNYYWLIAGISAFFFLTTGDWLLLAVNAYYLIFMLLFFIKDKLTA